MADQGRRLWGLEHDPDTEVTITTGATEAVFATLQGLLDVGDEVVVFEPSYDSYTASIAMAGAVPRPVPLRPDPARGRWVFDLEDLRVAVGPRTRLILLNSPHNPTGKVFDRQELAQIAAVALEHDLVVVTDEVYEHLTFDVDHVPMASLPGMWERTVRISSAGKSYSVTGWKVGWVCAPAPLTAAVRAAKQFVTFTSGTPFQHAVAVALQWGEEYLGPYRKGYAARRQLLCDGLREAGWDVIAPEGTYFAVADLRSVGITERDIDFCRRAPAEHGVAAVPVSVFCQDPRATAHLIRLAFCKTDDVIAEGVRRLEELVVR